MVKKYFVLFLSTQITSLFRLPYLIFWYMQRKQSLIIYDRILSMGWNQLAAVAWGLHYLIYNCAISFIFYRFQIEHKELISTQNRKKHILWILISSIALIFFLNLSKVNKTTCMIKIWHSSFYTLDLQFNAKTVESLN